AADRYQTARALADDLEHWLADEPITAALDAFGDKISRFGRRHRGAGRVGGVAVTLLAIGSTIAAVLINGLANSEREAKSDAQGFAKRTEKLALQQTKLAEENAQLAKDEQLSRVATERQLRIATAERLAAIAQSKRLEAPQLALLLAIES